MNPQESPVTPLLDVTGDSEVSILEVAVLNYFSHH